MKLSKENNRIFISSMLSTLFIIALFCGLAMVEKNARYIAFGDNTPLLIYKHDGFKPVYIKFHFMGKDYILNNRS